MGARFVRLGVAGFKSFADPVWIELQPGLTGIVGPNGCGKSNVAEALRWAMGEANARNLRGGEMDDVIFAGTASRASRNLAEVTLQVESDENGLPPPFAANAELQVVRRIERGSGGSYRVNGREARARDVQTLFADLASGARSSAMISQGRVGSLVNARPEDRRAVLEEAAGITGLHARRAEAETRLRSTEANLERAEERRQLLARQLDGLTAQAKEANRYRTVSEAAMVTEAALLALQRGRARQAREAAEEAVGLAIEAVRETQAALDGAQRAATAALAEVPALREAESLARTGLERARMAGGALVAEEERARAALAAARQLHAVQQRDLAHAQAMLADSAGAETRLLAETERLEREEAEHPALAAAAEAEAAAAAAALHRAELSSVSTAAAAAEAGARLEAMRQVLQQARMRLTQADAAVGRLGSERDRAAGQLVEQCRLDQAEAERSTLAARLEESRLGQDVAEAARETSQAGAAACRAELNRLDGVRHRVAAETAALEEVLSVKDGETWRPLLDRINVREGFEGALGAALGDELSAAADPAAARHWRALPPCPAPAPPGHRLDAAVDCPDLLARALSVVGVVDSDADGDTAQRSLQPGQTLVSREGGVWRWDGYTVKGGTPTAAAIRLKQRNRLATLRASLSGAEEACAAARAETARANRAEQDAVQADAAARRLRRTAEAEAERSRAVAQQLKETAQQAASRFKNVEEQLAQALGEQSAAAAAHSAAASEAARAPDLTELQAASGSARTAVDQARSRDRAAQRETFALNQADVTRKRRLQVIVREREDRGARAIDLGDRVMDLASRVVETEGECRRLADAPARLATATAEAAARSTEAAAALDRASGDRAACESRAETLAASARAAERAVFEAREASIRAETSREGAVQAEGAVDARVAEREGALPPLPAPPSDLSAVAEERARGRLQRLLREREELGAVNLRAEIEAEALGGEIATIEREREELGAAIAKLRGSIGHLNREGRERLVAVFQEVDRHFQSLFSRMFGGGRAHLALVGSDDPLLAGLEIYAQPPGKKLAGLSLLSGGEQALTALSLIFAVFRCNPAPLCVLDEVDAPLDDANVERLCNLLADVVAETGTRFLVVTHHQLTMARMDRLYGVTMQERGVSRLLSVDLKHAVEMIEAIAAE